MKKIATTIGFILLILTFATAQQRKKETPQYSDDLGKQLEQMQRQMAEQMKKLFGGSGDNSDSTQGFFHLFRHLTLHLFQLFAQIIGILKGLFFTVLRCRKY